MRILQTFIEIIKIFLLSVGIVSLLCIGLICFISQNIENYNKLVEIGDVIYGDTLTDFAMKYDEELREKALGVVEGCDWTDNFCFVNRTFHYLEDVEYRLTYYNNSLLQSPLSTYELGGGDCKSLSLMFCGFLSHTGKPCKIVCNDVHCWNEIFFDDGSEYVVEMTGPYIYKRK